MDLPEGYFDIFRVVDLPSTHPYIKDDSGGRAISYTDVQGYLCFGQYRKGYPEKSLRAYFTIAIDDNQRDDRNILILDVYDHDSDRVIGKRLLTRKDFLKVGEECLFVFDFTPISSTSNMEFRIYYMGWAYILATRIVVVDPQLVTIQSPDEIPEAIPEELPDSWRVHELGDSSGSLHSYHVIRTTTDDNYDGKTLDFGLHVNLDVRSSPGDGDNLWFLCRQWTAQSGNGKIVAKFSKHPAFIGVMFRETLEKGSRFILLGKDGVYYRDRQNGASRGGTHVC